jgi:hypothetical protein
MSKGRFSAKGSRTRDRGSWIPRAGLFSAVALLAVVAGLIVGPIASIAGAQETDTSSSSTGSQQTTTSEDPTTTTAPPASDPAPAPSSDPAPTTQPAPTPTTTTATPTITSDKADYAPGDQVTLTGANWLPDESVHVVVNDDVGQTWSHDATVQANAAGTISDVFTLPSWFIATYSVTATGSSGRVALATFTDSSGDLDQCANGSGGNVACTGGGSGAGSAWQNGNLNQNQARYLEGQSVPYRLRLDGLSTTPNNTHTATIEWDTTEGGKHSLDYLTSWDRNVAGGSDPCSGVTGCGSPSTFPIPADPNVTGANPPVTPVAGNFTLYNGTISSVSPYSLSGSYAGNSKTSITITFTATAANPVLAWGGHIATQQNWGLGSSAGNINGSSYHMRFIELDDKGGNQDRSLSAEAVILPAKVTVVKDAVPPDAQDFGFTATGLSPTSFTLDDDADPALSNTQVFSDITTFGHKVITEGNVSTWDLSSIQCLPSPDPNGSTYAISVPNRNVDINLKEGADVTCTFTNTRQAAQLTVIKHVINDNGGTAVAGDFSMTIDDPGTNPASFPGAEAPGTTTPVDPGAYSVSESGPPGYTQTDASADCTGSIAAGQHKTCTITNNDNAPKLHLRKEVVNDNGGSATVAEFTLKADGTGTNDLSGTSPVDSGAGLLADTWALSETSPSGYTPSAWVCVGGTQNGASITLGLNEEATCTITNNDQPGTIIVKKMIKPTGSSTLFPFQATGSGYNGFSLAGGTQNSQTLNAGSYTVQELVPLGWVLTGIGGSTDPNTPYNCTVTGTGGSTGAGNLNTQTASVSLKNGDTVTCVFENTGQGVTRTQGFWATHTPLANIAWFGGTAFGHTFPGVAGVAGIGDNTLCGRPIDTLGKLMGGFWSDISKTSTGQKRSALDQARMQLLQQLLAAELNASAFGSVPSAGTFAAWEAAYCGTNQNAIKNAQQQAASFNTKGDSSQFTPGTSADSKNARAIADLVFWNILP